MTGRETPRNWRHRERDDRLTVIVVLFCVCYKFVFIISDGGF